jgi:hypothetical protein
MPTTKPVSIEELKKYPTMARWFDPRLLAKLLWRVIISDIFGQYADRRLIVAALDPASDEELLDRAKQFEPGEGKQELWTFAPDQDGAVWLDFVADLGDGFDATYAIASLLSQEKLAVGGVTTSRGQVLIMGGDEVYPNATREKYQRQLQDPYNWAFPDPHPKLIKGPPVFAIPGNHDWYDGLVLFLALFSRKEHMHLGGWRSHQRRSYFALQITTNWWVWAIDSQLDDDVDQPQKDYFVAIAKGMSEGANIILCGPEPGWLYTLKHGSKSFSVVDYVGWIALNRHKNLKIPLILSGDTHHYSRYSGDDGVTQFVTSGGGGAFLHSTHQLQVEINLDDEDRQISWLDGRVKKLSLNTDPNLPHEKCDKEACYPARSDSLNLLRGNFKFVRSNVGFAMLLGAIYWIFALVANSLWWDAVYIILLGYFLGFYGYTKNQEGGGLKVALVSAANALVHSTAVIILAQWMPSLKDGIFDSLEWPRLSFIAFAAEMITIGGLIGGWLFGVYLYVSSRWLNLNHHDAFSSMRLDSHRHFLRIRIKGDELTIFPIGLDRVPRREEWQLNTEKTGSPSPVYVPKTPITTRLIEDPIKVRSASSSSPSADASGLGAVLPKA